MKTTWLPLYVGLLALATVSFADEDDDSIDNIVPEDCIQVRSIKDTDIVDDKTIIFHMRNGKIYRNILDHKCNGLKREESFMYETRTGRLCDIDIIKVLDDFGGGVVSNGIRNQMMGPSCFLGKFYPIDPETAQMLIDGEVQQKPPKDETEAETENE